VRTWRFGLEVISPPVDAFYMKFHSQMSPISYAMGLFCLGLAFQQTQLAVWAQSSDASDDGHESACPTEIIQGQQRCMAEIAANSKLEMIVDIPADDVRDMSVQQLSGTVHVLLKEPPGAASAPATTPASYLFANAAGRLSRIRILMDSKGQTTRTLTIDNSSSKPATIAIEVEAAHGADVKSALEEDAERAFAIAEELRTKKGSSREETLAAYDKAIGIWEGLEDSAAVGRALTVKAFFLFRNQNDATGALKLIQTALQRVSSMSAVETANTWRIAGYINAELSHYEDARKTYTAALDGYTKTGDQFNQESVLENLSRLERLEGNTAAALSDATQAESLAEKIGDQRGQLAIEEQIGSIYTTSGNLELAYNAYERALGLLKVTSDAHMEGYVWSDLGVVYTELGDFARAHDALDQASSIWQRSPYPFGEMNTLDDNGDLLLAEGQLETARRAYARGLDVADKQGAARYRIFFLRGIGDSYLFQKDSANAEKNFREALDLAVKSNEGDSTAYLYCALGDTALQRGDKASARDSYTKCSQDAQAKQDAALPIRAAGGLARTALLEGDLKAAEAHSEEALAGIESQRGSLSVADLRTSYFASMHAYYDLEIQILSRLDQTYPGEGYRWKAFLVAERGRARTLLDQVTAGDKDRLPEIASPLRAQYDEVLRKLRMLESKSAATRAQRKEISPADGEASAQLNAEAHALRAKSGEADNSAVAEAPPLTLQMIQAALPGERSALIEYWTGEDASYMWAISHAGVRMVRLPAGAELGRQIDALRQAILSEISLPPEVTATQRAQMLPEMRQHTERLESSVAKTLFPAGLLSPGVSTLAVVADGPTLSAPFAALASALVRNSRQADGERIAMLSEPSAAIFSWLESHPIPPRPLEIAIFTDAGSGQGTRGNGNADNFGAEQSKNAADGLPALSFAGGEAEMIRSVFGASAAHVFSGASATPASLNDLNWDTYRVAHFATHAVLNNHYAELNGLVTGTGASQMLWYGDVCHLHARLDLVVLSACDTALGKNIPGEGLEGLTQAFFVAGSQRVVGTLWQVDDQATSAWMRYFYTALKATGSPTQALSAAQRAMAASPQWSSPYYWAGFTLAGDWRPLP
jgi:CHAT domain-containing protein/predicted negative regulator of RcsB-dependent stress response